MQGGKKCVNAFSELNTFVGTTSCGEKSEPCHYETILTYNLNSQPLTLQNTPYTIRTELEREREIVCVCV